MTVLRKNTYQQFSIVLILQTKSCVPQLNTSVYFTAVICKFEQSTIVLKGN